VQVELAGGASDGSASRGAYFLVTAARRCTERQPFSTLART